MRTIGHVTENSSQISEFEEKKPTKINFVAPFGLVRRIRLFAIEHRQSQSDIIRKAIELFIKQVEEEKIAREIEQACDFYYAIDKKIAEKWRNAETKV